MRILMPSIVDPQIARSGAATVTRNLVQLLEAPPLNARIDCVPIRRSTDTAHRIRQAAAVARSLVSTMPAKVAYTYSRAFRNRVVELANDGNYDLVAINGSDLLWLEPLLPPRLPRLLVAFNVEHLLFASQAERPGLGIVMRPWLALERQRLERHELRGVRGVGNVVFLSTVDASQMETAGALRHSIVVPPMFGDHVSHPERPRRTGDRLELGFLGNLHWWPNRRALSWFMRKVLPFVARPVHLHVFGEGRVPRAGAGRRVSHYGPIVDVAQVWDQCDLIICPMRSGGGVSIKLAEAVFNGLPTLATPFAVRGLPLGADPSLVIRAPDDWLQWLGSVEPDQLRNRRISEEVSRAFTFGAHRDRLHDFVRSLASEPHTANRLPVSAA